MIPMIQKQIQRTHNVQCKQYNQYPITLRIPMTARMSRITRNTNPIFFNNIFIYFINLEQASFCMESYRLSL